jgi:hypothetical protein
MNIESIAQDERIKPLWDEITAHLPIKEQRRANGGCWASELRNGSRAIAKPARRTEKPVTFGITLAIR